METEQRIYPNAVLTLLSSLTRMLLSLFVDEEFALSHEMPMLAQLTDGGDPHWSTRKVE